MSGTDDLGNVSFRPSNRQRPIGIARVVFLLAVFVVPGVVQAAGTSGATDDSDFPRSLESYEDGHLEAIGERLLHRAKAEPFNVVATLIFFLAIIHTFFSSRFLALAHHWQEEHDAKRAAGKVPRRSVSHRARLFHFLGEVEVIFGLWAVALGITVVVFFSWSTFVGYVSHRVNFTEAIFVVVIMTLASTRPILWLSESLMGWVAGRMGGTLSAWWFTILTMGPLLGSFITEPAAMTIAAMLLARKFYALNPGITFKYATIGLLFVNISVGGTLTHFAAPPVLMVAGPWGWETSYMLSHFGWKAAIGILVANTLYFALFRGELRRMQERFLIRNLKDEIRRRYVSMELMESRTDEIVAAISAETQSDAAIKALIDEQVQEVRARLEPEYLEHAESMGVERELAQAAFAERFDELKLARLREQVPYVLAPEQRAPFFDPEWDARDDAVPAWVVAVHVALVGWTVLNAHHPPLFIAGLLFFLGFAEVTSPYQNRINLKAPLLVGFFLAGLVLHGGFQGWWIEPVLGSLGQVPLMVTATVLTAFNDNAAITYLTTLIPDFSDALKYAVLAGAVSGGGLTVIANAPNPAGQSLLKGHFENGVSPIKLCAGALAPTIIVFLCFLLLG
ncbi:MAG: putative Na+/H+ antiporter [Planctomycetota bacterium]|jgi:hypothetical protein